MRRGVSFIEILVGSVLLVLCLVPLYGLSIRNTQGIAVSLDEVEATVAATTLVEALQAAPFELLEVAAGDPGVPVGELDPDLLSVLRLPPLPPRFALFVNLHGVALDIPVPPELPAADAARIAVLCELRAVEVVCRFETRGLGEGLAASRQREIRLKTLVSRVTRP